MANYYIAKAAQLAPLVERVHGGHHPELTRVREITQALHQKDRAANTVALFQELRAVTDNYAIPHEVCEAFEATYHALERADKQQQNAA